jgi:DNA polymerase-3 subunit epsilon
MLVLGVDVETWGLDAKKDEIAEIAFVLWDTEEKAPLTFSSRFIKRGASEESAETEALTPTGLKKEWLASYGVEIREALEELHTFCWDKGPSYIVAHNASFDRSFFEESYGRHRTDILSPKILEVPWICTMRDIPFKNSGDSRKLSHLAMDHGFMNPFPHRALFDVMTCLKLFSLYPLEEILAYRAIPTKRVKAVVSYDQKDLARDRKYRWFPEEKAWMKDLKETELDQERADAPFPLVVLK